MLREASQDRVDKAIGACPVCQWPYGSGSIFCSSCGVELVRLEVFPNPNELLTLFEGFPVIMRFENTGKIPVELERLDGVEWASEANWPVSLEPKEKIEIRRLHTERLGQRGRLTLHSTLSPISFRYRGQKAPRIWLTNEQGREFDQDTDGAQLWPVNEKAWRHNLALHATSEVVLEKCPRLFQEEQVSVLENEVNYPFRLAPYKAFSVELTRHQDLSEEGHPVHLVFPIQNIGDVEFRLNLKYTRQPVLKMDFNPLSLSGDTALISGSRRPKEVSATITHLRGAPLRINSVTSNTPWLQVVDPPRKALLDSQSAVTGADEESGPNLQLQLQVKTIDIPRTTESKHFEPEIIVKGEAEDIEAEDPAFEERFPLPVEVIPPKPLNYPIGIDFGTTNSCLAYYDVEDGEMLRLADLESDEPRVEIPTVFQLLAINKKTERLELSKPLEPNEHHLVATENEEAIMRFGRQPFQQMNDLSLNNNNDVNEFWNFMSSICWSFKYALSQPDDQNFYISTGMSEGILINGHPSINRRHISLTPMDQVAIYLRFMVEHFIGESGYSPSEVVLTYPAIFNRQKQALQNAVEQALQDHDIKFDRDLAISEPEAIAVYYVWKLGEDNPEDDMDEQIIGVFDCDGGTTDMSIVRYTRDDNEVQVKILGSDGDNLLGGNLLTFHLAKYFYEELVPEQYRSRYPFAKDLRDGLRTQGRSGKKNFLCLYQLAEEIKINSKTYQLFDQCFSQDRYEELQKTRDKGLLDLLKSDEELKWPKIELVSPDGGDVLQVTEGLKRSIKDKDEALQEELAELSPMKYEAIRSVFSRELKQGFKKLAMMQKELYDRGIIAEMRLDHLILAGNSSKLPIVQEVALEEIQAKKFSDPALSEAGSNNDLKASVASGAAIYGMSQRDESPLQVSGIHKLNYPIGFYSPMRGFSPIFDRWISLDEGEVHPYASKVSPFNDRRSQISLYEFFDWNYKNRKADRHKVADILIPLEDRAFRQVAYWQYKLELRGDENNLGRLYYNFAVGQKKDGSDFEEIYGEYLECKNFNYS
jgi:molecular chaperone DnaK (HSP70)